MLINLICWTFQFQNLLLFAKILASSTIDWKIEKQNRVHQSMWHFQFIYTIIHLVELDPIIAQFKSIWILFNYIHVALAFRTHTHTHHGGLEVIHILHKTQWKCARIYENLPCVMCCAQYFADGKTIQVVVISICDVFFVNWVFNLIIPWSNFFLFSFIISVIKKAAANRLFYLSWVNFPHEIY